MADVPLSIPISALQHMIYCPRQCALIHVEQIWADNRYTAEGQMLHQRVDSGENTCRGPIKTCRSVHLYSDSLGLHGVADVVEFYQQGSGWQPHPVEYKRGKPKETDEDRVQLCAQGMCLEEMHDVSITSGDLYYGTTKRRVEVPFDSALRELVLETISDIREMIVSGATPQILFSSKCLHCSLVDECMPHALGKVRGIRSWNDRAFDKVISESD